MKRRRIPLFIGIILTLCGTGLLLFGSAKPVQIIVNGESRTVYTHRSRTADILSHAGIPYKAGDRIRPGLTDRIKAGGRISLDRAVEVTLETETYPEPVQFITNQRFGGNILLDAGLQLFPGDRLYWDELEIRPDFNLAGISSIRLRLERAGTFTLITEDDPGGIVVHGSGKTVNEALRSADIMPDRSLLILPDEETGFIPGMSISVLRLRELTISHGGEQITAVSAGTTVGDALARAGMPLMGSDVSIPAAEERLPDDGYIRIIPAADSFTMNAEIIRRSTEWSPNADLSLDDTRLITEGMDGLRGSITRLHSENGEEILKETSPESVLVSPVSEKREYGTKLSIRTLDTPEGPVEYYRAVKVYATSYSPCRSGVSSCISGTASGMKVQKGVAAVTSGWYNQFGGQTIYVPGYGKAVIGDVGGGIPGRYWIDLAYSDDDFEGWSRETTVYFLTPVPSDMVWVLQ